MPALQEVKEGPDRPRPRDLRTFATPARSCQDGYLRTAEKGGVKTRLGRVRERLVQRVRSED